MLPPDSALMESGFGGGLTREDLWIAFAYTCLLSLSRLGFVGFDHSGDTD